MKIIKRGRKLPKQQTVPQYNQDPPPFPRNWKGPHMCPKCSCIFELEDSEKNLVSIPEIAMGCDADYYIVHCPHCEQQIIL